MSIQVRISDTDRVDRLLGKMPIALREKTLIKAVRKAARIVAKEASRQAPKPGYVGDVPGLPALSKNIKAVVRTKGDSVAGFVGPTYPAAPHGHLVEFGHEAVFWGNRTEGRRVEGKPYLRPAADETESAQQQAIITTLKAEIGKLADK